MTADEIYEAALEAALTALGDEDTEDEAEIERRVARARAIIIEDAQRRLLEGATE